MANSDVATVIDVIATSNAKFCVNENVSGGRTDISSKKPKRIPENEIRRAL